MNYHNNHNNNNDICRLLGTLPPQYPVESIVVDGFEEDVNAFVNLEEDTNLAYFTEPGGGLVVADCRRISQIDFPPVP
jgi:hypothetical protein